MELIISADHRVFDNCVVLVGGKIRKKHQLIAADCKTYYYFVRIK